jgi:hypothetical protein
MIPNEAVERRVRVPHSKPRGSLDPVAANAALSRRVTEGASRRGETGIACPQGLVHTAKTTVVALTQCAQEDVDRMVKPKVSPGREQFQRRASPPLSSCHAGA